MPKPETTDVLMPIPASAKGPVFALVLFADWKGELQLAVHHLDRGVALHHIQSTLVPALVNLRAEDFARNDAAAQAMGDADLGGPGRES